METSPIMSPSISWTEFSVALLARFISQNLIDRLRNQFLRLDQGIMSMSKYEARFHELSRHAIMIVPMK